jgi:acyl carrier protein
MRGDAVMSIEAAIERYITRNLLYQRNQTRVNWDQDLFSSGLLDSLAVLQLIFFMEEEFAVSVEDGEIAPDTFRTINLMKAFIEGKLGTPSPVA